MTVLMRGLPRAARALRQARLDRDDRGGRVARFRDVLRALLAASSRDDGAMLLQAITIDDRAYEVEKASRSVHQHLHLPRRVPAVARGDRAKRRAAHRHADGRHGGSDAALRRDAEALARELRGARSRSSASAATSASGASGGSIWPTARPGSRSAASGWSSWRSPSRSGARRGRRRAPRQPSCRSALSRRFEWPPAAERTAALTRPAGAAAPRAPRRPRGTGAPGGGRAPAPPGRRGAPVTCLAEQAAAITRARRRSAIRCKPPPASATRWRVTR